MKHVLVVGGTGMLRDATLRLGAHHDTVSVIGRDEGRLVDLIDEGTGRGVRMMPWSVDYRDEARLSETLTGARAAFGPIGLVVAWIHSVAPKAPGTIARSVAEDGGEFRWFHIFGTGDPDSAHAAVKRQEQLERIPGLRFRGIFLGRIGDRWLNHDEISDGVFQAVRDDSIHTDVGEVSSSP